MKTVFFIGQEKPLVNLKKYGYLDYFLKKEYLVLTTDDIAGKHDFKSETLLFSSNWKRNDWRLFCNFMMLQNYFVKSRSTVNLMLWSNLFGPYKIRSMSTFFNTFKYFVRFIISINWLIVFKNLRSDPITFLKVLRQKKVLGSGDYFTIKSLLKNREVNRVILFTTFNEPILFDLIQACNDLRIQIFALPDCWDNISTSISIPSEITNLFLWSKQQLKEVETSYPSLLSRSMVLGSYRFDQNSSKIIKSESVSVGHKIRILYLEGSIFEDRNYIINSIITSVVSSINSNYGITNLDILLRRYPGIRSSEFGFKDVAEVIQGLEVNGVKVTIQFTKNSSLNEDLKGVDIVFSELTTAALESAYKNIYTIFVGSNRSPKYISTNKSYEFSFARELKQIFTILDFENSNYLKTLSNLLSNYMNKKFIKNDFHELNSSKEIGLNYIVEPLDREKWEKFIEKPSN